MQDPVGYRISEPPSSTAPRSDSFFSRLGNLITSPGKAMEGVKAKPRWLQAGLLIMVVMALFVATTLHISGPEEMEMLKEGRFGEMMPQDVWQQRYDESLDPTLGARIGSGFARAAWLWIIVLFVPGLIWLLFSKLAGGLASFSQVMGVVFWAEVIGFVLGTLVRWPLVFVQQTSIGVATGPAIFASGDPMSLAYRLLSLLDLFGLWSLAVMVIGFERVNGFSRGKAVAVAVVPWIIRALLLFALMSLAM